MIEWQIPGIRVPTIMGANSTPQDPFPFANAREIRGAPQQVISILDRDAIPRQLRQWGQYCHVLNLPSLPNFDPNFPTPANFQLTAINYSDIGDNSNWLLLETGSSSSRTFTAFLAPGEVEYDVFHNLNSSYPDVVISTHSDHESLFDYVLGYRVSVLDSNSIKLLFSSPISGYRVKVIV